MDDPAEIFRATFERAEVAEATSVPATSIKNWLTQGLIVGHAPGADGAPGVDQPGQPGIRRQFTFRNAVEIAIGASLIRRQVELEGAFHAAATFAHTGEAGRIPGLPFAGPVETLIVAAGDRSAVVPWSPSRPVLANVFFELEDPDSVVILRVNKLFDRVVRSLGYDPAPLRTMQWKEG